ncbi:site-2 protease family protein [Thermococcus sp.]
MKRREVEDLIISFLVLVLLFSDFRIGLLPYASLAVLTAFVFHELAHKLVAERYGYATFYRRWDAGIVLALLVGLVSRVLSGTTWVFAAVGAVQIYAPYMPSHRPTFGKIALAGPAVNVLVGITGLLLMPLTTGSLKLALALTTSVNLWIAFLNLWPIPPLDGWKVLRWNAGVWAISTGLTYALNAL